MAAENRCFWELKIRGGFLRFGAGHTTGVSREESEEPGAVAGKNRQGGLFERRRNSGNANRRRGQRSRQGNDLGRQRKFILRRGSNHRGAGGRRGIFLRRAAGHLAAAVAAAVNGRRRGAPRRLRGKERCQCKHESTKYDRGRFHSFIFVRSGGSRQTGFGKHQLFFVRRADLGEVFFRIFVEILFAAFAAQFYFLILVGERERFTHLAKFFAGDGAGRQQIRRGVGAGIARHWSGHAAHAAGRHRLSRGREFGGERHDAERADGQE